MKDSAMKKIEVVAAVIIKDNKVFCCRRPDGKDLAGYFEFPGGKIESNETHKEALTREIKEELNTLINVNKYIMTIDYSYPKFNLIMHIYECSIIEGNLELLEHSEAVWCDKKDLDKLNFTPADKKIIEYYGGIHNC